MNLIELGDNRYIIANERRKDDLSEIAYRPKENLVNDNQLIDTHSSTTLHQPRDNCSSATT